MLWKPKAKPTSNYLPQSLRDLHVDVVLECYSHQTGGDRETGKEEEWNNNNNGHPTGHSSRAKSQPSCQGPEKEATLSSKVKAGK